MITFVYFSRFPASYYHPGKSSTAGLGGHSVATANFARPLHSTHHPMPPEATVTSLTAATTPSSFLPPPPPVAKMRIQHPPTEISTNRLPQTPSIGMAHPTFRSELNVHLRYFILFLFLRSICLLSDFIFPIVLSNCFIEIFFLSEIMFLSCWFYVYILEFYFTYIHWLFIWWNDCYWHHCPTKYTTIYIYACLFWLQTTTTTDEIVSIMPSANSSQCTHLSIVQSQKPIAQSEKTEEKRSLNRSTICIIGPVLSDESNTVDESYIVCCVFSPSSSRLAFFLKTNKYHSI